MIDLLCSHIGIFHVVINHLLFYRNIQCFMDRIKLEELYILSCEKGSRPKAVAFFTAKNVELRGF